MKNYLKRTIFLLLFGAIALPISAQRPKIGLALSGGGAKGLAHIGILQAIDSAGLKIDYISGTSMGSIVGAMYAIGYSADTIETIARSMDWSQLLSNKSSLETTPIENKSEYGRYLISLPIDRRGVRARGGVIESQELWLKLHEIYQPAFGITNFKKFNIPFVCLATDLQSGKSIVLSEGDLVQSVRASMALPSIFTPVNYKGTKLIDGGVVQNFPVNEVKQMGANYLIGVSVSEGLEKIDKLNTPLDILQQVAFFKDAENFVRQKKMTHLYIQPELGDFTGGSFASADSIINIGIAEGKKYYPVFKRLADSLKAFVPTEQLRNRLIRNDSLMISDIKITGLRRTKPAYFLDHLNLSYPTRPYTIQDVNNAIRHMYSTGHYERITYDLEPLEEGGKRVNMQIVARENSMNFLRLGVHYAPYTKIAIITNLARNNFFHPSTSANLKLNISENFRAMGDIHTYLNRLNTHALKLTAYFERYKRPRYEDYRITEVFSNLFGQFGSDYYLYFPTKYYVTAGAGFVIESIDENISLRDINSTGITNYFTARAGFGYHSLNRTAFPTKGARLELQVSQIFGQQANETYTEQMYTHFQVTDSVARQGFKPYQRFVGKAEYYQPLTQKITWTNRLQAGANFNYDKLYGNAFFVGGVIDYNRNQIAFAGFKDAMLTSSSVAVAHTGVQYALPANLMAQAEFGAGFVNFTNARSEAGKKNQFITGGSLTLGYNSGILPVYLSMQYSPQSGRVVGNINVGYHF